MKQAEGKHVNMRHGSTRVWMCAGHLRVRVAASPSYDMCRDSQHDQIWFPWLRMPHFKAAAPEFLYPCPCQRARISIYPILCFAASVPIRDAFTSAFLLWIIEDTRSFRVSLQSLMQLKLRQAHSQSRGEVFCNTDFLTIPAGDAIRRHSMEWC